MTARQGRRAVVGSASLAATRIYTDPTDLLTREAADLIGELLWPDATEADE